MDEELQQLNVPTLNVAESDFRFTVFQKSELV